MKYLYILSVIILSSIACTKQNTSHDAATHTPNQESKKKNSYWTCSMHPEIHMDHPGECPICHMKLIEVTADQTKVEDGGHESHGKTISPTATQLELIGAQKHEVEKMTLKMKIPVSGRIISSSAVAFQIYEQDLRYVKSGLHFFGESSSAPEVKLHGNTTSVDSIVDPTSRTVRVVGQLQGANHGLLPESSFSGAVEIELKDRIAIPESSVMHTGQGDIVYKVIEKNKLAAHKVILGQKSESYYEVVDGLEVGDEISSGPNFLLDSEAKVRGVNDHQHH